MAEAAYSFKTGLAAKAYLAASALTAFTSTGSASAATWTAFDEIMGAKIPGGKTEKDITTRGTSGGFRLTAATLKEASVTFDILWNTTNANFTTLKAAYDTDGATITALFCEAARTLEGAEGVAANWSVTQFDKDEDIDGIQIAHVTLKPASFPQVFVAPGA